MTSPGKSSANDRAARLSAALRENLKRRKAQARERSQQCPERDDGDSPAPRPTSAAIGDDHGET